MGGSGRRQVMKRRRRLMEGSSPKAVIAALKERVGYSKKTKQRTAAVHRPASCLLAPGLPCSKGKGTLLCGAPLAASVDLV